MREERLVVEGDAARAQLFAQTICKICQVGIFGESEPERGVAASSEFS